MADRRMVEADLLARQLGSDSDEVKRKRQLAQELLTAADEAEREGQKLRKEVPHGMVQ